MTPSIGGRLTCLEGCSPLRQYSCFRRAICAITYYHSRIFRDSIAAPFCLQRALWGHCCCNCAVHLHWQATAALKRTVSIIRLLPLCLPKMPRPAPDALNKLPRLSLVFRDPSQNLFQRGPTVLGLEHSQHRMQVQVHHISQSTREWGLSICKRASMPPRILAMGKTLSRRLLGRSLVGTNACNARVLDVSPYQNLFRNTYVSKWGSFLLHQPVEAQHRCLTAKPNCILLVPGGASAELAVLSEPLRIRCGRLIFGVPSLGDKPLLSKTPLVEAGWSPTSDFFWSTSSNLLASTPIHRPEIRKNNNAEMATAYGDPLSRSAHATQFCPTLKVSAR